MFFYCVNLCHECIVVESRMKPGVKEYSGPSTDEVCFLNMANKMKECGWFHDRNSDILSIQQGYLTEKFKILKYFPFTSDRKASSIVVQNENGQIFVFVKGAD